MKVLRFADALPPLSLLLMLISCSPAEQQLVATGTIEAVEVRVSAKVGGQVLELSAEEGSSVIEGQVLARIDHSSLDLQLAQARAGGGYPPGRKRHYPIGGEPAYRPG